MPCSLKRHHRDLPGWTRWLLSSNFWRDSILECITKKIINLDITKLMNWIKSFRRWLVQCHLPNHVEWWEVGGREIEMEECQWTSSQGRTETSHYNLPPARNIFFFNRLLILLILPSCILCLTYIPHLTLPPPISLSLRPSPLCSSSP